MKAVVTGAAGQLGRALLAAVPQGWQCTGLARGQLDLTDHAQIARFMATERPDWVINAAAYTAVDRAEAEQGLAWAVNALAPGAIAQALEPWGGRVLQVSTDYVFDGAASRPYLPDDRPDPLSAYGKSKLAGELAAGPDAVVLRTSGIFSAHGRNFVTAMLDAMQGGGPVRVVADQITAPSHAAGVARTAWALAQRGVPGIYHHRDAGQASWYEFALAIGEEAAALGLLERNPEILPVTSAEYGAAARRPAFSVLDDSATRAALQDSTAHWRETLEQMLREEMADG